MFPTSYASITTYVVTNTLTRHSEYMSARALGSVHRRRDNHTINTMEGQYLGMATNGAFYAHMSDPVRSRQMIARIILASAEKQSQADRRRFAEAIRMLRLGH